MPSQISYIVTGGNTGLGLEAACTLATISAAHIVIASRSAGPAMEAAERIRTEGGHASYLPLDLLSQASVRAFADGFRIAELPPLAGIVCNAGMQNVTTPTTSAEGYEATFAVNHLGHYLLVRLLLDDIIEGGRISVVASGTHNPEETTGMPDPHYETAEAVAHDLEEGRIQGMRRYTTSKLCNVFFTYELNRLLKASDDARLRSIRVNAFDPGLMPATGLARSWPTPMRWIARNLLPLAGLFNDNVHSPAVSGSRLAELTTGPSAEPGGLYFRNGKPFPSSKQSHNDTQARELWETSARMTGLPINLQTR
ncbi:SDR family NAD(P)-dependent oxidoreductase [Labrenzia sp. ac12]